MQAHGERHFHFASHSRHHPVAWSGVGRMAMNWYKKRVSVQNADTLFFLLNVPCGSLFCLYFLLHVYELLLAVVEFVLQEGKFL